MGLMPWTWGGSSYKPDKGTMKEQEGALNYSVAPGGSSYFQPGYYYKGQPISEKEYNQRQTLGLDKKNLSTGPSQYETSIPKFSYQPGESGFTAAQQGGTYTPYSYDKGTSYNQYQYSPVAFEEQVSPYYKGLESSAQEGMKQALSQGIESAKSSLGSRGFSGGGMANEATGSLALQAGQGLADTLRNIRMDKAKTLTDIAREQQALEFQREQAQAGEGQFGATFGEGQRQFNANLGENQAQFGANFGESQAARKLQEVLAQYGLDSGMRQEQYGYATQPYNNLMQLYLGKLPYATQKNQSNVGSELGSFLGGLGSLI